MQVSDKVSSFLFQFELDQHHNICGSRLIRNDFKHDSFGFRDFSLFLSVILKSMFEHSNAGYGNEISNNKSKSSTNYH